MAEAVTPPRPKDSVKLRQEIKDTCFYLRDKLGYFIGTWGNLSIRIDEGMLLTPTRLDIEAMSLDDLVVVDMEGRKVRGERTPTSELEMHRTIYLQRPDFGAIVHSHSPWASTFAAARKPIPMVLDDMAEVVGGQVNCSEYVSAMHHKELAASVCRAIGPDAMAVLIASHGIVAGGRTMAEAVICNQFCEKAAQVTVNALPLGGAAVIPDEAWRAERHRYLHRYGKAEDLASVYKK